LDVDVVPGRCSAEQGKLLVRRQLVHAQELANGAWFVRATLGSRELDRLHNGYRLE
jgi:hypothetical protein